MSTAPAETEWQRLDPRMMLVHPIRELMRFLPAMIGLFVAGAATGAGRWFQLAAVVIPIGLGLARYYTTRYRIHADRVELKRGLLSTHILSTPLDRVRTVDLTASPVHRVLGLATVRIGTGTAAKLGEDGLDLDGLPAERARALRAQLLTSIAPSPAADPERGEPAPVMGGERLVARFEPGWLRYAPFTSAGFVLVAGILGVASQVLDGLGLFDDLDGAAIDRTLTGLGALVVLPTALLAIGLLVTLFSVLGYLVANGNFALSHTLPDGSWHVRRGLLTTRETSLDDDRLRGVAIGEPWGLKLVRGGRLSAIVTGLDRSESGSSALLPPTPRALVNRVAADVIGTPGPVHAPLADHGSRARTRRYTRALLPALVIAAFPVALAVGTDLGWFAVLAVLPLLLGLGLGFDRARSLGHTLVDGWLVARSGSLLRKRELLATDAIIGWNLRSTWFQRRAGLATLVATTAGGSQSVTVLDVPEAAAVDVASAAVPGLLDQFSER
ncbi:MAG: PH domain-containing protein [Nocardioides sp.]